MLIIPLLVNAIVICVLAGELVAIALGMATPDQLLVSSTLSGLLVFLSFKLSKEASQRIEIESDAPNSRDK